MLFDIQVFPPSCHFLTKTQISSSAPFAYLNVKDQVSWWREGKGKIIAVYWTLFSPLCAF